MSSQINVDELFQMLGGALSPKASNNGKGELVIAGSGLAPLRQMTLETIQFIRSADIVYHGCQTAAEEAFVKLNAKDSFDLRCLYGPDKARSDTYVQMAEMMMRDVRAGKLVVGLLYGHPGVFATPGHRAIAIARQEGYPAKMLPGISAEDNLLADLGVEPALPGTAQFEASALVYGKLEIDTGLHSLIWQPGTVGKATMEMNNNKLYQLIDYLEEKYGNEHPIYVYRAGTLPGEQSYIAHHTTVELRNPDVANTINPSCTLYIPPKKQGAVGPNDAPLPALSAYRLSYPEHAVAPLYGERETAAVVALDAWLAFVAEESAAAKKEDQTVPGQYNPSIATPAMQRAAIQLAVNHHNLPEDNEGRAAVVGEVLSELTAEEKAACLSNHPHAAEGLMRARQNAGLGGEGPQYVAAAFLTVMYNDGSLVSF